jgi:hypothetical protein
VFGQSSSSFYIEDENLSNCTVAFKEINNLILIPLFLNDSDTLYFILDSGAENITLFSSEFKNAPLDTSNLRQVKVVGAGKDQSIEAYISPLNKIEFGGITGDQQTIVYIPDSTIKFSDLLGHPVHGILGIPIFKSFVIEIDYPNKVVTFYKNDTYLPKKKYTEVELTIMGSRPFIELNMELQPRINLYTTLLLDSGESKPLSLFLNSNELLFIPYPNYFTNLGKGLNGMITGKLAKITGITLGDFIIYDVITAFPDEENIIHLTKFEERNGSIGAGILKRFTSVIDLENEKLYLKRNKFYRYPFKYDKTGIIIVAEGLYYDYFRISGVVKGSAGDKAGAKENDRILKINGVDLANKKIGEVMQLMEDGGRIVELEVLRDQKIIQLKVHNYRL